jgi:uncharacterized protein (TIGR01777 family)
MNLHLLALQLMAIQGCLGAFDTLYHHELTEALPRRARAGTELAIHALRSLIYSALFVGLSSWHWQGAWALVLVALFAVEIVLTLWDFVVEDRTRLLPATERVTHTILALNGGAFMALLALHAAEWYRLPTAVVWAPNGALGIFLLACGAGVGMSGIRDAVAARRMMRSAPADERVDFGGSAEQVLVTGATGFIGHQLVNALLEAGHQVTVLTRTPRQAAWQFDGRVRCIAAMDALRATERIDVIVNLAGARILGRRWTRARRAELRRSRIGLTDSVVGWIGRAERKPRLMLSASAIGYYGIQAQGDERTLGEDSPPQPVFMSELCREWEQSALKAKHYGVAVACMRFGLVLGQNGALPMMLLPIRFGLGGPLGSGQQWLSWIHVDDVVRAIGHLWSGRAEEAYNFTAAGSVTQDQFSATAASVLNRPCCLRTPGLPVRLALGEQADLLLEGQRVAPVRLCAAGFVFRYPDLRQALASVDSPVQEPRHGMQSVG